MDRLATVVVILWEVLPPPKGWGVSPFSLRCDVLAKSPTASCGLPVLSFPLLHLLRRRGQEDNLKLEKGQNGPCHVGQALSVPHSKRLIYT